MTIGVTVAEDERTVKSKALTKQQTSHRKSTQSMPYYFGS